MDRTFRLAFLSPLLALSLAGCVSMDDYERKAEEAAGLRREVDEAVREIEALRGRVESLEGQVAQKEQENEELVQSLSMSRRHGQQRESQVVDLRGQLSTEQRQSAELGQRAGSLERAHKAAQEESRNLQRRLVATQKKLLRFEDRIRFQVQLEKDMKAQLAGERKRGLVKVRRDEDRVTLSISSAVLFESGSAAIRTDGKALLIKMAGLLRRYRGREIQVQGHTDNVQISSRLAERWETNWELSAARATRVLRYFVEVGNLNPRRASAAGMGEFRPVGSNKTAKGRRANRRIEILVLPSRS